MLGVIQKRLELLRRHGRNVAVHVFQVCQCELRMKQRQEVNSSADNNLFCWKRGTLKVMEPIYTKPTAD